MSERSQKAWELSLSAAISRRRDSIATDAKACSTGDCRWNRSSGGRFAWTALAMRRAVHAARRIGMGSPMTDRMCGERASYRLMGTMAMT
ncbi:hypothetical protein [Saliphagus sp. LR7]|uniref:hypothetical protein n=1 Tax=Saliphagus sp. LR7 TaxID=2282654 RepID=UPI0018E561F6|nr:hypothetical protein [Saliphagus sp. LR7]